MHTLIIGAGIMGLCTARALARQDAQVTVVEQGPIPNPLGSSVDQHRLIRHCYGAERGYTRMVTDAYREWDELWAELGERLYVQTGTLALASADTSFVEHSAVNMAAEHVALRRLSADEVAREFPLIVADRITTALHAPGGGVLFAEQIVAALARCLRGKGVTLHQNTPVRDIDPERACVTLASGEVLAGDALLLAAGPWTNRLLPHLTPRMTPSRQVVVYLRPPADLQAIWERAPILIDLDPEVGFYMVPSRRGLGVKMGDHRFSRLGEPEREREARREEIAAMLALARPRLRRFDEYVVDFARTCFYDVAEHERFIVEKVGARGWVMTGFSGHGFKFGPALGRETAAAILGRKPAETVRRWAAGEIME
jgi:glycine/D-amino acid oxidase-like deaminating enzyme